MRGDKTSIAACWLICLGVAGTIRADEPPVDFNRDIRPILSDRCFVCHGPDATHREADLRLDLRENAHADLGGYHAIVPGEPDASELIARVTSNDPDMRMPPAETGKPLDADQVALLRRWIAEGAAWSDHWAYVPPRETPPPAVHDESWPLNWIDRFVLARLDAEEIAPSPDADRVTLIRRLSFDLIGLPPTPEEIDAFVTDESPDAYEKLIDRLLASDRFGERMAVFWLDLVRYADTVGYHGDQDHNISPYRDYVIDAFNDNMPFDQFTREQLAGDLLPDATVDQKIASGYNRLLQTSHEGGVQPKEYLAIYAADRVRNLSVVWMGATMGCAQCHDHKFDPLTMRDFYSMEAFFADLDEAQHFSKGGNNLPTNRPPEIPVLSKRERRRVAELETRLELHESTLASVADQNNEARLTELQAQIDALKTRIQELRDATRLTMISVAIEPRTIRVLPRGDWLNDSGEVVLPATPTHFPGVDSAERRATRLDLANWLTDVDDGYGLLTARVFANRFWALFFGRGISKSLDDFGGQGEPPAHPELLDNLALAFVESGWDVKQTLKQIVMSRAYRQQSIVEAALRERDPLNRLFARQARYRLPAEMVRDAALSISGLLVLDYGGGSVRPYQPEGYYRHLNFPTRTYEHHADERQWRRGVYVHWQRQFLHPMLKAFDAPSREECAAERPRSNTPLAALTLLNDPTFVEASRAFAARIIDAGGAATDSRIDHAFRLAVSRSPDAFEVDVLTRLLDSQRAYYAKHPKEAEAIATVGLAPPADVPAVELAAWTAACRAILNMSETITRN